MTHFHEDVFIVLETNIYRHFGTLLENRVKRDVFFWLGFLLLLCYHGLDHIAAKWEHPGIAAPVIAPSAATFLA